MNLLSRLTSLLNGPQIMLIACQPKTASTFLTATLGSLPQSRAVSLVPAYGRREQELSAARIKRYRFRGNKLLVAQHHVRYSEYTGHLIKRFDIKTIVLTRNLFDVIASIRDHVRAESHISPMFFLTENMVKSSDENLELMIAHFAIPWYLNFYLSWLEFPNALRINYDELCKSPAETMSQILWFSGSSFTIEDLDHALVSADKSKMRLNRGVPGRGATISVDAQMLVRRQIELYSKHVPDAYLMQHLD